MNIPTIRFPQIALSLILLISLQAAAQSFKEELAKADNYISWGKHQEAQAIYLKHTSQLNPVQQHNLAVCYYNDPSQNPASYTTGMQWLLKAADGGNSDAMNLIAYCYQEGLGVKKDSVQQLTWVKKAADFGNKDALGNLAYFFETGYLVPKDKAKAKELYLKAIDKGSHQAAYYLAFFELENGNTPNAYFYMEKAAQKGFAPAQFELGKMYEEGTGTGKKDPDEAFRWYNKIIYSAEYATYYQNAQQSMRMIGQKEPMTDLEKVRPLLQKLVARASEQYYDLRGKEIKPYNPESEFGTNSSIYYVPLFDLGFKNSYIRKKKFNQQQAGGVVKAVEKYTYYGELLSDASPESALKVYNQWVNILKKVLPDWKVSEDNNSYTTTGVTTLTKTIKGLNFIIELRLMTVSSYSKQINFTIDNYGDL